MKEKKRDPKWHRTRLSINHVARAISLFGTTPYFALLLWRFDTCYTQRPTEARGKRDMYREASENRESRVKHEYVCCILAYI